MQVLYVQMCIYKYVKITGLCVGLKLHIANAGLNLSGSFENCDEDGISDTGDEWRGILRT